MRWTERAAESPNRPKTSPLTVLVMDDDPIILETAAMLLEDSGHRVITGLHLRDLEPLVDSNQPDVVFIDLNFADEVSIPALARLRRRYPAGTLSLVVSSGYSVDESTLTQLAASQLQKPWGGGTLRSTIEKEAQKKRQLSSSSCAR